MLIVARESAVPPDSTPGSKRGGSGTSASCPTWTACVAKATLEIYTQGSRQRTTTGLLWTTWGMPFQQPKRALGSIRIS